MTNSYIPAYGNRARTDVRSLERALALRRMVIAKSRSPPDQAIFSTAREVFDEKGAEAVREAQSARALINGLITQGTSFARCPLIGWSGRVPAPPAGEASKTRRS